MSYSFFSLNLRRLNFCAKLRNTLFHLRRPCDNEDNQTPGNIQKKEYNTHNTSKVRKSINT
jgi:hypothetical protein